MQIIFSAVNNSKEGIFGNALSSFFPVPQRISAWVNGTYKLHYFLIPAASALNFLQQYRDLSMQLWTLPVSSLECWSKTMKAMQQKCWLYWVWEKCCSYSTHGKACYDVINPPQQPERGTGEKPAASAFLAQPILSTALSPSITSAQFRQTQMQICRVMS